MFFMLFYCRKKIMTCWFRIPTQHSWLRSSYDKYVDSTTASIIVEDLNSRVELIRDGYSFHKYIQPIQIQFLDWDLSEKPSVADKTPREYSLFSLLANLSDIILSVCDLLLSMKNYRVSELLYIYCPNRGTSFTLCLKYDWNLKANKR